MKIYNFPIATFQRNLLISFLLISAVLYNFSGIFFGLDFTDSFYHLNQALKPANGIYLYPFFLSSVILKSIVKSIGPEVINLRVINWLLLSGAMLLPFFFLKVRRAGAILFFYFAITLILYSPFNANILGYDTLSIFINAIMFSLTALYIRTRRTFLIPIISFVGAAAVLIRLPNILAIPVVFLFLLVIERIKTRKSIFEIFLLPGCFLCTSLLLIVAGYSLYYETWEQFVNATSNANSHDLLVLFINYFKDGVKIIGFLLLIISGLFCYKKLLPSSPSFLKDIIFLLFLVISLLFLVGYSKYSVNYALFLVALAIALVLIQTYYGRRKKLADSQLILFLFLFFLFINPFGSNTGLLKSYSLLLLFPFVLSISNLRDKRYWIILLAVLIPFSVVVKIFGVYEDKNMMALDKELRLEKLSLIRTNSERACFLEKVNAVVQKLNAQGIKVFFYGDKSHIFHYLYPKSSLNQISFFQPVNDLSFLEEIEKASSRKKSVAVFVVNSYPENSSSPFTLLKNDLKKMGFEKVEENFITYYVKK